MFMGNSVFFLFGAHFKFFFCGKREKKTTSIKRKLRSNQIIVILATCTLKDNNSNPPPPLIQALPIRWKPSSWLVNFIEKLVSKVGAALTNDICRQ